MIAPTVRGVTAPVISTGAATTPASTQVGDLVLFFVWSQGANSATLTHTLQSGFTEIRQHAHDDGTTDGRLSVAYRVATATGANAHTPFVIANATANQTTIGIVVLTVGTFDVSSLPPGNSSTLTTNAVPNPPIIPSAGTLTGAYRVFAIGAWHVTTAATTAATVMANYAIDTQMANTSHVTHLAIASRAVTLAAGTEDPGAWGDNVAPNGSVSMTIAVRGVATVFQRTVAVDAAASLDIDAFKADLSFDIGAHGEVVQLFGQANSPAQITFSPQASGSSLLALMGGMDDLATQALTDNRSNTYAQIGATQVFTDWAGYGWTAKWKAGAVGGAGTILSQVVTLFDEISMIALELIGATVLEDTAWTQQANSGAGPTQLSGDIDTAGPAIVVALWGGAGPVGNGFHRATPNNGFRTIHAFGVDDPNGYVQFYVAYKIVAAGTHNVTWTHSPTQGAILGLLAFRAPAGSTTHQRAVSVDAASALDLAATRAVLRSVAVDGATALDVVARRAILRSAQVDGVTQLDVVARRAVLRSVAADGATSLDVVARRAVLRSAAVDGSSQLDIAAARALLRSVTVDAPTALDIDARRAVLRAVTIDAPSSLDVAATRVVQRSAAVDASTQLDVAAVRAVLRAIAVEAETQLQIIATNPGAGPQTHARAVSVDAGTSLDVVAARAILRSIQVDALTSLDASAARAVLRSVQVDGGVQLDIAAARAILRAVALDVAVALDIVASGGPAGSPQTHARSVSVDAETLLEIVAELFVSSPAIATIFVGDVRVRWHRDHVATIFMEDDDV